MKKYRLIKEYPGSPKLGSILTLAKKGDYGTDINNLNVFRHKNEIENHPEFWEEVIEKDYMILSFKNDSSGLLYTYHNSGKWVVGEPTGIGDRNYEYCLKYYNIHSVERISDGEVFTVGDRIEGYKNTGIKKIILFKYGLRIITDANGDGCVTDALSWNINNCIKDKCLFTTEDGVDIYEGDKCFSIFNDFSSDKIYTHFAIDDHFGDYCELTFKDYYNFSTKEAAEEYILMNKPCLSLKDIFQIYPKYKNKGEFQLTRHAKNLIELVKSKL